ncbi:hypothetical protein [Streptomyces sp. Ncost-T10-10d]|uniref:hypothetical protein n=1 Tax=Streptomyces sp. Ncost-T10-10d TaxID=1839774 RepID=UPI00081ED8F2|nr:hypothetical protein [Streptomyces sp. Ncost-T10-10d]SCF66289.1 hypothetical protein GA0115254_110217 [Streptomyces sp. Ncost-T10-10d]
MSDKSLAVTVLLDPHDEAAYTRAALAAHHPAAGRVTVHPAPGTTGDLYFAHDLLAALGKPPLLPGFPTSTAPVWEAVTAWMAALPVTRLTVLRAHLLTPRRIQRLIDLRALTGLHLVLVCHRPRLPAALQRALQAVAHSVVTADDFYGPAAGDDPLPLLAPPRHTAERWITLPTLDRLASSDGSDHCIGCTPPMVDWKYRPRPRPRTPQTIAEVTRRIHAATAHPRLAAALATAVFTGAAGQQLDTARGCDYDDRASTLALHDPIRQVDGCATYPVPPWAKPFLRAAAHFTRLAPAQGRPLLTQPADHRHLLQLAETARLRPPQPPAGPDRAGPGVEWLYRELKEAGLDAEPFDHISRLFARPRPGRQGTGRRGPGKGSLKSAH